MRLEILIFGITGFLLYNAYYDGKYTKILLSYKKYYKMILIGFLAICFFAFGKVLKRNRSALVLGVGLFIIGLIVHGLIDTPYLKNDLALIFWLVLALL